MYTNRCLLALSGQEFLKGIYSQKVPDMEALTSELAHQTRHPPPGESSHAETPEIVVQEGSATSDRIGKLCIHPPRIVENHTQVANTSETVLNVSSAGIFSCICDSNIRHCSVSLEIPRRS